MNEKVSTAIAKPGTKVLFDSFSGLVKAVIVKARKDPHLDHLWVTIKVTEDSAGYDKGKEYEVLGGSLVPAKNVRQTKTYTYITSVRWSLP